MKKSLTNIYVTHNAKDKTYDEFYNALGTDLIHSKLWLIVYD